MFAWGDYAPSSVANAGVAASPASPPTLSGVLSLLFLHLHTKFVFADCRSPGWRLPLRKTLFAMYAALNCACGLKEGDNIGGG
jgi:hypothetical protein